MVKLMAGAAEAIKAPKVPEMKPLPVTAQAATQGGRVTDEARNRCRGADVG